MTWIRFALIKTLQACAIAVLSLAVVACLLVSYSYLSGDRQDRAEMLATAEHAIDYLNANPRGHSPASLASEE
jgi:hypothetical protein